VADALAAKFGSSSNPLYGQARTQTQALRGLQSLQARFIARGDYKNAARIGKDIRHMEAVIKGRIDAAKTKAKTAADQQTDALREANRIARQGQTINLTVPIDNTVYLNGRLIEANLNRFRQAVGNGPTQ